MAEGGYDIEMDDLNPEYDREEEKTTTFINQQQTTAELHNDGQSDLTDDNYEYIRREIKIDRLTKFFNKNEEWGRPAPNDYDISNFVIRNEILCFYNRDEDIYIELEHKEGKYGKPTPYKLSRFEKMKGLGIGFIRNELGYKDYKLPASKKVQSQVNTVIEEIEMQPLPRNASTQEILNEAKKQRNLHETLMTIDNREEVDRILEEWYGINMREIIGYHKKIGSIRDALAKAETSESRCNSDIARLKSRKQREEGKLKESQDKNDIEQIEIEKKNLKETNEQIENLEIEREGYSNEVSKHKEDLRILINNDKSRFQTNRIKQTIEKMKEDPILAEKLKNLIQRTRSNNC